MSETKKQNPSMARLVIVLFAVTAIVALLLGLVNYITADKIKFNTQQKTAQAMSAVLSADSYEPMSADSYSDESGLVSSVYSALDEGGNTVGYVVEAAPVGFGGAINMVIGIKSDGTVSGVSIVKMSETSGLGANAKNQSFRDQYTGLSGTIAVDKDGGTIDALTGATVTSRAVTSGVNAALKAVSSIGGAA